MGRLRSFFKRAAKPFAMASVAMALSTSLVVTTPSNAQAFVAPAPVPAVFGATRMAIPALMPVAATLGPVGWGLAGVAAATMLGVALYETRDTWIPWVEGQFGASTEPDPDNYGYPAEPAQYYAIEPRVSLNALSIDAGGSTYRFSLSTDISGLPSNTGKGYRVVFRKWCKKPDGTVYRQGGNAQSVGGSFSSSGTGVNPSFTNQPGCTITTDSLVGIKAGPPIFTGGDVDFAGVTTATPGPANIWKHGFFEASPEGEPGFDPRGADVTYTTTVDCINAGGTVTQLSAEWTGDSPGMKMPSCEAAGLGHGTGAVKVDALAPGKTEKETVWDVKAPAPDPNYPLCSPARAGSGCKLAVKIDGKECVMGLFECENWQEINNADPGKDGTSPRVSCQYGPYSVPLNTCNPLERAYEPDGAPVSEPNIDGNPATRSDANLDGSPQPKPDPFKQQTVSPPVPGGAGAPAPSPTGSTAAKQAECWPTGWGMLNPLEWVYKPIVCAFTPSGDVQAKMQQIGPKFENKAPFVWVAGAGAVVAGSANVSGSCPDWTINVAGLSENVVCESSFTQAILSSRGALFGLMVIGMFWPLIRSIWYSVIPILRPAPIG
jgi:hypothetical protein